VGLALRLEEQAVIRNPERTKNRSTPTSPNVATFVTSRCPVV
jgi:hypothetical protein